MRGLVYGRSAQVRFSSSEEFYYVLGFLADYRRAAIYWEHNEDQGAWGSEGRIHCLIPQERFPDCFKFTAGRGEGVYARINCNDYVGCLVNDHGFKTRGAVQDVEKIISTVPSQYWDIFEKGYGKRIENKAALVNTSKNETKSTVIDVRTGDAVEHKAFGHGVVEAISGGYIHVKFGTQEKSFQYPGAFENGFLKKSSSSPTTSSSAAGRDKDIKLSDLIQSLSDGKEYNDENESVQEGEAEGKKKGYYTTRYERSAANRRAAINEHGTKCMICGFDFEAVYGALGKGYIEVHHIKPLATRDEEVIIDPKDDLVCVCANCHRMLHRFKKYIMSIEELKAIVDENKEQ